jgi:DNA repair exonuclease SbcCD ATPase subunit
MDDIQPLNELGEREVKQEEVVEIMEKMKTLSETFADLENNLKPLINQLEQHVKDVDGVIDGEKGKCTGEANDSLGSLDEKMTHLEELKTRATEKLKEYNDGIDHLKETEGAECPILLDTLTLLSEEAKAIEESIADLEAQIAALNDKKNEHKVVADDAGTNPATFTPK